MLKPHSNTLRRWKTNLTTQHALSTLILLHKHNGTGIKIVTGNWPNAKLKKALTHSTMLGQTTSLQCTRLWVKHIQIQQEYYRTNYYASTLILPISLVLILGIYHVVGRELYLLITISLLLHLYIILFRVLLKFRKILKFSHCWILIWQPNCTNNQQS